MNPMNWIRQFLLAIPLAGLVICCGGGGSTASNSSASNPPSPPAVRIDVVVSTTSSTGDPQLSWQPIQNRSVTSLKVYRSDSLSGLDNYSFLQSLPAGAGKFTDMSCREGVTYKWAISCCVGDLEGPRSLSVPFTVQILGPINVTAVTTSSGIEIHWTNRSARATQLNLMRTPTLQVEPSVTPDIVQSLDPKDQQFLDVNPAPGVWCYRLVAGDASIQGGGGWVSVLAGTTGSPSFSGHVLPLPFSSGEIINGIPDQNGRWELAAYDGSTGYADFKQLSTGWTGSLVVDPAVQLVQPGFAVDAAGFPHYVALVGSPGVGASRQIVHFWKDANGWNHETIATRAIFEDGGAHTGIIFAMRPSGLMTLVWQLDDSSSGHHFEFATNESGSWKIASIPFGSNTPPSDVYSTLGPIQMTLGPDGTTHLGVLCYQANVGDALLLEHRTLNGAWSEEFAPTGAIDTGFYNALQMQPMGQSGLVVGYQRHDPATHKFGIILLSCGPTGWGSPMVVAADIPDRGIQIPFKLCTSMDGSRSALVTSIPDAASTSNSLSGDDLLVFMLNGASLPYRAVLSTHESMFNTRGYAIGFDSMNHFHLLGLHGELPLDFFGQDTLDIEFDESY